MKFVLKNLYSLILYYFYKLKILSYKKIPIVINNFNRVSYLKILIADLEVRGYSNIYVLDNASTYAPLLEFYKELKYPVIYLRNNIGHLALQNHPPLYKKVKYNFFVYTDPDLHIIPDCPDDFLAFFLESLCASNNYGKVGFGLRTDDLPDHYVNKKMVIDWEKKFRDKKNKFGLFDANIDTTFSLHKPMSLVGAFSNCNCMRSDFPYVMQHLPWYENSFLKTEEQLYYEQTVSSSSSWHTNPINSYQI